MKHHRFYQAIKLAKDQTIELDSRVANHISRVLRMRIGETICLFNGRNEQCQAILVTVDKRKVVVKVAEVQSLSRESGFNITLVQALSKGDRFDLVVQKAVELGVDQLIPVQTERNVVKLDEKRQQKKQEHWHGIIESASEQCGRNQLMQLSPIQPLKQYLVNPSQDKHFILDPYAKQSLSDIAKPSRGAVLMIGPEGGWSDAELAQLKQQATAIQFGPRILRTETAAITACGIIQALWGDLK